MSPGHRRRRLSIFRATCVAVALSALVFSYAGPASGTGPSPEEAPFNGPGDTTLLPISSLIVKYKPGVPTQIGGIVTGQTAVPNDVTLTNPREDSGGTTVVELEVPLTLQEADAVAKALETDANVEWAQPNRWMFPTSYPASPPNDTNYSNLWGLWDTYGVRVGSNVGTMTPAWPTSQGNGVVVAVLDTGQIVHPDLGGVTVTNKALTTNVATLTTGTPHGFAAGNSVIVFGLSDSAPAVTVTNKALTSNVVTITTAASHGLTIGNTVSIAGVDSAVNIATRSRAAGVASITTAADHGLVAGSIVTIAGVDVSFNGSFTVATAPTTTSFTFANPGPDGAADAGGNVASTIFNGIHTVTAVPSDNGFQYASAAGTVASVASAGTTTRSIFDGTHTIAVPSTTTFTFNVTSGDIASVAAAGAAYRATGGANTLPGYDFVSGGILGSANCPGGPTTELVRAQGMSAANSNQDGDVLNTAVYGALGRDAIPLDPGDWGRRYFCSIGNLNVQSTFRASTWHGTHVAGTVAAVTNNAAGIAGVSPNAKVVPIRVLAYYGGQEADIAAGIRWAAGLPVPGAPTNPNPAKIINMSLGGTGVCGATYQSAIDAVRAAGSIVVVSAMNENVDVANATPANCNGVISVAATNKDGNRSKFSNFGSGITIAAPGGAGEISGVPDPGIFSTFSSTPTGPGYPGGETGYPDAVASTVAPAPNYGYASGTSMAAPHVSGVIALMLSATGGPTTEAAVRALLQNTAQPFANDSICDPVTPFKTCGFGIVNAAAMTTPQLSTANPASSAPAGGGTVVISGSNLTNVTSVQFGTVSATFNADSATQITATVPAQASGTVNVTVRSITGRSNRLSFSYAGSPPPPTPDPGGGGGGSPAPAPAPVPTPTPLPNPDPFPVKPLEPSPVEVMTTLTPTQVQQLTATQLAQLPPQAFAVMTPFQIRALLPTQITPRIGREEVRAITPSALRAMQPRTLNAFRPWQLRALSLEQARQLRPAQIRTLGPAKKRVVETKRG